MLAIDGAKDAALMTAIDQFKIAIVGPPKGGKSKLAATCRKPAFMAEFDGREASVAGTPGLIIKSYVDVNPIVPQGASNLMIDIGKMEYSKSQNKLEDLPKTIIIDSMTYFAKACMNFTMANNSAGVTTITLGGQKIRLARGYDPYEGEMGIMLGIISRCFALGVDVICCFHETDEEAPDSTNEKPRYTGKKNVHPARLTKLLPLFNELWRVVPDTSGKYECQVKPDYTFLGGTTLSGLLGKEEPNIENMIKKHLAAVKK
jgi:hypothetical protein